MMKFNHALLGAFLALLVPAAAGATTAVGQTVVSMTVSGSSCSVSNNSDPSFGTLTNPITATQTAYGAMSINCGSSSPALKLSFNDAVNSGTYNFTMTNSSTSSATQPFQICDYNQFSGSTCPNGYEYKNTTADAHALATAGTQSYNFYAYFVPSGSLNLASGSYFDTITETITF